MQQIAETDLVTPAGSLTALAGALAPGATTGKVTYSNTRTIWIEPVSGNFVKVREQQRKNFVPDQGSTVALLDADFVYDEATIANSVKSAGVTRDKLQLIGRTLPIGLAVLGVVLLLLGLWLLASGRRAWAPRRGPGRTGPRPAGRRGTRRPRVGQPAAARQGGPLSDEIPPASTNWRAEDEAGKR